MRQEERGHVVWGHLGFFDEEGDGADWQAVFPEERCYSVGLGVEYSIPKVPETLTRLVLARYAAGEYTTAQVAQWLQTQDAEITYGLFSKVREEQPFENVYDDICDVRLIREDLLGPWLLLMHRRPDFYEDDDAESDSDGLLPLFESFLPEAAMELGEGGGGMTSGGTSGDLCVPAGRSLSEVLEPVEAKLEQFLDELEPTI